MCGIAGVFSLTGEPVRNVRNRTQQMIKMLDHRGPDDQGVYVSDDGLVGLGNNRLAITDPNCKEPLPMVSSDGRAALTFNGEIYNHRDLRENLLNKSTTFKTHIDTEIVLEGIRNRGLGFQDELDGIWAFAYYDSIKKSIVLSRDLMGERHLFYRLTDTELIFASEPAPIIADSSKPLSFDYSDALTAIRFCAPAPGRSLIGDIQRLLPGHQLIASPGEPAKLERRAKLHPEKWFDFFAANPTEQEIIAKYEEVLHKVCRDRVPDEVPFFSTLSGGIDSGLISLFASDFGNQKIKTLFGQSTEKPGKNLPDELDEFSASLITAKTIGSDHHRIRLDSNECVSVLLRMASDCFDGILDVGPASFEMLAHKVRQEDAKVILISDGPDELIGGYPHELNLFNMEQRRKNSPGWHRMLKIASSTRIGRGLVRQVGGDGYVVVPTESNDPRVFRPIHESFIPDHLKKIFPIEEINSVSSGQYGVVNSVYNSIVDELDPPQYRALSYADRSIPDMFCLRTDKAFMRASVESRSPFLAPEIVELMIATPTRCRYSNGNSTKSILRKIVEKRIGPEISSRSKHGFSAPLWSRPEIYSKLQIDETLAESSIFSDMPFHDGARDQILKNKPGLSSFKWPIYVLTKTQEKLKNLNNLQKS
jgi:asparagine synthase (glutamine-hydrolysing)